MLKSFQRESLFFSCILSSREIQFLHLSDDFEYVLKHLMYQKEAVRLFIASQIQLGAVIHP